MGDFEIGSAAVDEGGAGLGIGSLKIFGIKHQRTGARGHEGREAP